MTKRIAPEMRAPIISEDLLAIMEQYNELMSALMDAREFVADPIYHEQTWPPVIKLLGIIDAALRKAGSL